MRGREIATELHFPAWNILTKGMESEEWSEEFEQKWRKYTKMRSAAMNLTKHAG